MSKQNVLISFSGGRTSAFMAQWAKNNWSDRNLLFVFANTGKERKETLDFVHKCDQEWDLGVHWIEYRRNHNGRANGYEVVDYDSASRDGEPFEEFIKAERLPNAAYPNCSGRLKQIPIHAFVKEFTGWSEYSTAIGIRIDETQRINWESAKKNRYLYPLVTDYRVDKRYIRKFWDAMPFDLELKDYEGNCDLCWKKSKRKLLTMLQDDPSMADWWNRMETEHGEGYSFFRNNETTQDLLEEAKRGNFSRAIDENELDKMQGCLFDYDMDAEASCFCKD